MSLVSSVRRLAWPVGPILVVAALLVWLALSRGELDMAFLLLVLGALWLASGRTVPTAAAGVRDPSAREGARGDPILRALPDPAILVDRRVVVVDWNAAARPIAPALRPGLPLSLALRAPQLLEAVPRVLETGESEAVEIGGRVAAEPSSEVRVSPVLPPGRPPEAGQGPAGPVAALLTFRDLSAQRLTERTRVDFVANVSHELRTPLASILGFVETLQGAARTDEAARERFLGIIREQAQRMRVLIDDLLQLSRVEMRVHVPPTARVDLSATVRHIVETMAPLARDRDVALALDLPSGAIEVLADRDELLRLVENLLANAIKYGGSGGRVEVGVARSADDRWAELSVRDHGPGIAREHLPRLTERFYRVDAADSRAQGGTGLGLAIVKHIVTRHRGRLSVESEPGQGALFTVRLPIGTSAASPG